MKKDKKISASFDQCHLVKDFLPYKLKRPYLFKMM